MNKLYTFFHTRAFLSDMLVRYSAHNRILEDENEKLRKKLGAKDKVLQKAIDDHAQSDKFHQQVINNLHSTIDKYHNDPKYGATPDTLEAVDIVCLECPGSETDCESCMVRKLADSIHCKNLSPETEQDYIDQIIERQVEEHDAAQPRTAPSQPLDH